MARSLARAALPAADGRLAGRPRRRVAAGVGPPTLAGLLVAALCLGVYLASNPERNGRYNHFVWQAAAWLEGEAAIRYPVFGESPGAPANWFFQDVLPVVGPDGRPTGRALVPFPPLPALVLLPFVALFGLATNAQLVAAVIGGLDVALAFWVLGRLGLRLATRLVTTLFFGLGTVLWYAAMLGTTWYLAHLVAVACALLAIGLALGADRRAVAAAHRALVDPRRLEGGGPLRALDILRTPGRLLAATLPLDPVGVAAGILLGLAATARLSVAFGLPFLLLVGGGRLWPRRAASALLGMSLPILGLLTYNVATTGHLFHPGYEALYRAEVTFYPRLYPYLEYHADWGLEDPRYLVQNLRLMLLAPPEVLPPCPDGAGRGLFDPDCPWLRPRDDGLSLVLVSPAWLLGLAALGAYGRSRLVTGAALAVVSIAIVNLMHFSQGWVQFGYRFSNDFAPFLLLLVGLGIERLGSRRLLVLGLVAWSIVVNAWGVVWGVTLGW